MRFLLLGCLVFSAIWSAGLAQNTASATAGTLTLAQAEQLALRNNPRLAIARLTALAEGQVVRETRSDELPSLSTNLTAVDSHEGSRITAGALNNPVVYQRAAGGITVSQLITDFGRSRNLVGSAELRAQAAASNSTAASADIVVAVDEAFFRALGSQAVLEVANQTVNARQATSQRVNAMTDAKLKSTLDLNFANVDLARAQLLAMDAENENRTAMAALNALLGEEQATPYKLVDERLDALPPPPQDPESLVAEALKSRPDLASLNEGFSAARKFSTAEHDLSRPTISAIATAGSTPVRADQITSSWYGAAGVNVNIPIFKGFLYSARASEADLRAAAAEKRVEELRQAIARDVRAAVLQAQSNFQRIAVTQQLIEQANSAFDLAQTRYKIGLSSIVELSQAQLAQTQAQIDFATARYAYQSSLAVLRYQTGR